MPRTARETKTKKTPPVFALLSVVVLVLSVISSFFWRVNTISCEVFRTQDQTESCTQVTQETLNQLINSTLLYTDFYDQSEQLLADSAYQVTSLQKSFNGTITIVLQHKEIVATILYLEDQGRSLSDFPAEQEVYALLKSGETVPSTHNLDQENKKQLLVLFPTDKKDIVQHLDQLQTLTDTTQSSRFVNPVLRWFSDEQIVLESERTPPILLDTQTPSSRISQIDAILDSAQLEELELKPQEIDLRFELPVLRTAD